MLKKKLHSSHSTHSRYSARPRYRPMCRQRVYYTPGAPQDLLSGPVKRLPHTRNVTLYSLWSLLYDEAGERSSRFAAASSSDPCSAVGGGRWAARIMMPFITSGVIRSICSKPPALLLSAMPLTSWDHDAHEASSRCASSASMPGAFDSGLAHTGSRFPPPSHSATQPIHSPRCTS